MKKLLVAFGILFFAVGCNDQKESSNDGTEKGLPAADHEHETKEVGLTLNNGARWRADSSTNKNVRNMQQIADDFSTLPDKSMTAYGTVADALQTGLDTMISECRMQGADHDALHKWLEPLIGRVKKLKGLTAEEEAALVMEEIQDQLKVYFQYFE